MHDAEHLALNQLSSITIGWALMLVAMMFPLLIGPVRHICERSFKHRRGRSAILFIGGYFLLWMAAGGILQAAVFLLHSYALPGPALLIVLVVAMVVWQCSPTKQRCLNRMHNHPVPAAFGRQANWDAFKFGAVHALWCIGSCWALMLVPMQLPQANVAAMVIATGWMVSERLKQPTPLQWRLRGPGNLFRILFGQTRIRLHNLQSGL